MRTFVALLVLFLVASSSQVLAENGSGVDNRDGVVKKKVALIVGTNAYRKWNPLKNPDRDATLIAETLHSRLDFRLINNGPLLDPDRDTFKRAIDELVASTGPDTVVVFYYAGHGAQSHRRLYLVPKDAPLSAASRTEAQFIDFGKDVITRLQRAGPALSLVIVDACRDELPEPLGDRGPSTGSNGLSKVPPELLESTITVFSTAEDSSASDNGPFAIAFATAIIVPGQDLGQALTTVGDTVWYATDHQQRPMMNLPLTAARFYLAGPPSDRGFAGPPTGTTRPTEPLVGPDEAYRKGTEATKEKDYAEALRWYQKAAEGGNFKAMTVVGYYYQYGYVVKKDDVQAMHWYRKAAESGDADAMALIGVLYASGWAGMQPDQAEGARWYQRAAELGNSAAMSNLAVDYANGWGVRRDMNEAFKWDRKAAGAGYAPSISRIAWDYIHGTGVQKNPDQAKIWMQKAAAAGDIPAKNWLEHAEENMDVISPHRELRDRADGALLSKRYSEALSLYRKSANLGDPLAMARLGNMYERGDGLAKDYREAMRWYQKSAQLGAGEGMVDIGYLYAYGLGVPQNCAVARDWMKRAAAKGKLGISLDSPAFGGPCVGK